MIFSADNRDVKRVSKPNQSKCLSVSKTYMGIIIVRRVYWHDHDVRRHSIKSYKLRMETL